MGRWVGREEITNRSYPEVCEIPSCPMDAVFLREQRDQALTSVHNDREIAYVYLAVGVIPAGIDGGFTDIGFNNVPPIKGRRDG